MGANDSEGGGSLPGELAEDIAAVVIPGVDNLPRLLQMAGSLDRSVIALTALSNDEQFDAAAEQFAELFDEIGDFYELLAEDVEDRGTNNNLVLRARLAHARSTYTKAHAEVRTGNGGAALRAVEAEADIDAIEWQLRQAEESAATE